MNKTTEFQNYQNKHFSDFKIHGQGLLHYCDKKKLLYSRGKSLYRETAAGTEKIISLYDNFFEKWLGASGLYRRLTRSHIHHVLPVQTDKLVIFASKKLFYVDIREKKILTEKKVSGSRPLCVTIFGDYLYYGQYTSNPERDPIRLFRSKPPYSEWEVAKTFTKIRHIHGVFSDPFTKTLWVTTGDRNHESRIVQLSETSFEPTFSLGGNQMYRAVTLVFTEKYIYFGSDAPDQKNFIFRFKRGDSKAEKLTEVGGPIFYGCSLGDHLYFSTICEPSKVNRTDAVELWHSSNGDVWKKVLEIKKDLWSMKYFQYGQLLFPEGPGDAKHLWLSTLGTVYDQKILKLKTDQILKTCVRL